MPSANRPRKSAPPAIVAALLTIGALAAPADAALINWGTPTQISGDSDVSTAGTLVGAYNVSDLVVSAVAGSTTVNGVTFAPLPIPTGPGTVTDANFSLSGSFLFGNDTFGSNVAPFSNLSAPYRVLLSSGGGDFGANGSFTLTISGLTTNSLYQFQWWANVSAPGFVFGDTTATAGNAVTVDWNTTNAIGGLGQFVIGTFTADGPTQVITFSASKDAVINGFQLRDLSALEPVATLPEPGTALAGAMLIGLLGLRRRRN